jgi:hypothetical protein
MHCPVTAIRPGLPAMMLLAAAAAAIVAYSHDVASRPEGVNEG